jgi:hypothetical protein
MSSKEGKGRREGSQRTGIRAGRRQTGGQKKGKKGGKGR